MSETSDRIQALKIDREAATPGGSGRLWLLPAAVSPSPRYGLTYAYCKALSGAIAFLAFNGFQVSTLNSSSFSQVVFDFAVTGDLLVQGIVTALIIGLVGGFLPALRAARLPVAQALREL